MLQKKLRVVEDLFSERGCFLPAGSNLQKRLKMVEVVFC